MQDCVKLSGNLLNIASCSPDSDDDETRRYRRNWIVIHTTSFLMMLTNTIVLPSQYQFVTNPRHPDPVEHPNEKAGLGEDEIFYSVSIGIFSIGELIASLVFAALSSWHIKLKHLMMFGLLLLVAGGLFYAVAQYGWMVLVGRFLQGLHLGGQSTLLRIYIGETSNTVRDILGEDPEKSQLKNTNFLKGFALGTIGLAVGPGLAAIVTQIPLVDEFRWSGWYLAFHGTIQMLVVLVVFKENWSDLKRASVNCKRLSILSGVAVPFYCIVFMIVAFFVINCMFAAVETLLNPILSDNFGMEVAWISYMFLASLSFFPLAVLTIFILQRRGIENRFIFLGGLILGLIACTLMADWQAISGDPCDKFSGHCEIQFTNDSNSIDNTSMLAPCEVCKMHSGDPYHCFFNPDSRIAHEHCDDCNEFCRSELHSLNFVQLLVGVILFSFSFPLVRITMTIMFSDALGSASQSLMHGLLISSEAIARATAPVWGEAAYVAANHRSFLPIFLLGGMLFTILVIYIILFKKLKPYHSIEQKYTHGKANGDVVELVTAKQEEAIETEVTSL